MNILCIIKILSKSISVFSQSAAQFGLKGNPFDSSALSASVHSLLPIATAFVGREMSSSESRTITNILRIPGGGRFVRKKIAFIFFLQSGCINFIS